LNSDGNESWTNYITASSIFSSPANCIGDVDAKVGSSFVVGAHDGIVRKINCENGDIEWAEDVSATVFGAPFCTLASEVIVSTTAGKIVVLGCNNGRILAQIELNAEIYSSVIVSRNTIFVGCRDDRIYGIKIAR
jgi:outer membrane protein assembly factor BamB